MNKTKKPTNAVIYARGVPEAIERQLQACRAYAAQQGLAVCAEVVESKSANAAQTSRFQKLMEQVNTHYPDVVIVTDLSRLSRKVTEFLALQQMLAERNVQITALA
jgi:DNA invertase Pin-like site-specific DNA recombinase